VRWLDKVRTFIFGWSDPDRTMWIAHLAPEHAEREVEAIFHELAHDGVRAGVAEPPHEMIRAVARCISRSLATRSDARTILALVADHLP
jgi:hypothetical protein